MSCLMQAASIEEVKSVSGEDLSMFTWQPGLGPKDKNRSQKSDKGRIHDRGTGEKIDRKTEEKFTSLK
jgi:hypothetical protein